MINIKQAIKKLLGFILLPYIALCDILLPKHIAIRILHYGIYKYLSLYSPKSFIRYKTKFEKFSASELLKKEKVNIGFVAYTSTMWSFDELYDLLDKDPRFNVCIILGHFQEIQKDSSEKEYEKALEFYKNKKKFRVVEADYADQCDILFYLTTGHLCENKIKLEKLPIKKLIYHASYSYMLAGNSLKLLFPIYHWSYRYYTDSKYYLQRISEVEFYSGNCRYYGFPRMDQYYCASSKRVSNKITIIYAPHHSVNYKEYKSSTFDLNYKKMLELATSNFQE